MDHANRHARVIMPRFTVKQKEDVDVSLAVRERVVSLFGKGFWRRRRGGLD